MAHIAPTHTVGRLMTRHPVTEEVMEQFDIDPEGDGGRTLRTLARTFGFDLAELLEALEALEDAIAAEEDDDEDTDEMDDEDESDDEDELEEDEESESEELEEADDEDDPRSASYPFDTDAGDDDDFDEEVERASAAAELRIGSGRYVCADGPSVARLVTT